MQKMSGKIPGNRSFATQQFENLVYGIPLDEDLHPTVESIRGVEIPYNRSERADETPWFLAIAAECKKQWSEAPIRPTVNLNTIVSNKYTETALKSRKKKPVKENLWPHVIIPEGLLSPKEASDSSNVLINLLTPESPPLKRRIMGDYHEPTNSDFQPSGECNVAVLTNIGNTCFMNSVVYALRFTPTFLHHLHHLLADLSFVDSKLKEAKAKTSSLGRNGSAVSGSSWRSASSKDLLSIGSNDVVPIPKFQLVTESLHALYVTMNDMEMKMSRTAYHPHSLLQAVKDANTMFKGNGQQDAHEFFIELFTCLRSTCDKLNQQIEHHPDLMKPSELGSASINNNTKILGMRRSKRQPQKKLKGSLHRNEHSIGNGIKSTIHGQRLTVLLVFIDAGANSEENLANGGNAIKKFGYNFIEEEFQGVLLHRTVCSECETVSQLYEPFLEIQVPVREAQTYFLDSSIFGSICVTAEKLCGENKYFCENCSKYNEALRSLVYQKLPNTMVLHLKRFTTSLEGMKKLNTYVPTPLEIRCFCEGCEKVPKTKETPHKYQLSCVIMHIGENMVSGHYIAYSRASFDTNDYLECIRETPKNSLSSSNRDLSAALFKFFKSRTQNNSSEIQNGISFKQGDGPVCESINCCSIRKVSSTSSNFSDKWLELNDDKAVILSNDDFVNKLGHQWSTNTPYLLFYTKIKPRISYNTRS
ncbi:ubiquitin carboxyl-terminal hydrolase 46 isoform X1 [Euwallacea fornicatus]|uniref:ubiquitin carboxyl-terminal hydrolase 46 isoform X1 n=1 Tax=Euwallacea fornicatus TaxID=995702 RepID=UPI00338F2AEC